MTKHQTLVLTEAAVEHITRRLLFALNRSLKDKKDKKIYRRKSVTSFPVVKLAKKRHFSLFYASPLLYRYS
jgi:hypothetical protein